ncbi:MAG: hypothetical protein OEY93_12985, partial [Anaerolineae bacterium]|nr:hypothetical protein [Anaerolineae bacterium]
ETGLWSLYVVNYDGSGKRMVVEGADDVDNHSWSSDGKRLAYQAVKNNNLDVFTFDFPSETEYQVTDYAGADSAPTWECGNTTLTYTSLKDGNPNLFTVGWQGGASSNVTVHPATDKWAESSPSKENGSRGR